VLLVEQYLEFAWRLAGSYAIMRKGAIVSSGATADLRHDAVRQHLTV
jgi:urea transport system ATP-binding protein